MASFANPSLLFSFPHLVFLIFPCVFFTFSSLFHSSFICFYFLFILLLFLYFLAFSFSFTLASSFSNAFPPFFRSQAPRFSLHLVTFLSDSILSFSFPRFFPLYVVCYLSFPYSILLYVLTPTHMPFLYSFVVSMYRFLFSLRFLL